METRAKVSEPGGIYRQAIKQHSEKKEKGNAVTVILVAESGEGSRSLLLRREGRR